MLYRNEGEKAFETADMSLFAAHLLKHMDEQIPLVQLMTQKVVPGESWTAMHSLSLFCGGVTSTAPL